MFGRSNPRRAARTTNAALAAIAWDEVSSGSEFGELAAMVLVLLVLRRVPCFRRQSESTQALVGKLVRYFCIVGAVAVGVAHAMSLGFNEVCSRVGGVPGDAIDC